MSEPRREELFRAFRTAIREKIQRDLLAERATAEALRREVIPRVGEEVGRLRKEGRCGQVWLFGSYAWGEPTEGSDLDLLMETEDDPFALAAEVGRATRRMVHVVPLRDAPASLTDTRPTSTPPGSPTTCAGCAVPSPPRRPKSAASSPLFAWPDRPAFTDRVAGS